MPSPKFKHTPEEARDLWVKALRSGKYRQVAKRLANVNNGRCCLGVACDVYCEAEGRSYKPFQYVDQEGMCRFRGRKTEKYVLPDVVVKWLGVKDENPETRNGATLAGLNDHDVSFLEIAEIIENDQSIIR